MAASQLVMAQLRKLGYLFYIGPEDEVLIESLDQKKQMTVEVVPVFVFLIFLEHLFHWWENKAHRFSANDAIGSASQGMLMEVSVILNGGLGIVTYIWVYDNFRLAELPWDSWWTWLVTCLAVDFCYYWVHRAAHEVNLFWAGHQVHHSSEFYNLSTALRQSVIQDQLTFMFYLPMALCVPPQVYAVHKEFNLLYQFWIHTQAVTSIGPLEYILNTPSHHRVHHGVNRYCIDKNYAGVLIIWDRMFGTFQAEGEQVVYGVTHPIKTFDPYKIQFNYLKYVIRRFRRQKTWANALSVLFKGPGWGPGKPRLGNKEDLPDVHAPVAQWNPVVSAWVAPYATVQYLLVSLDYLALASHKSVSGHLSILVQSVYIFLALTLFGALFEGREGAKRAELLRLAGYTAACLLMPGYSFKERFGSETAEQLAPFYFSLVALSFAVVLYQTLFGSPLKENNSKTPSASVASALSKEIAAASAVGTDEVDPVKRKAA